MGKARSAREMWWREVVAARGESNESVKALCARLGVSTSSFYRWQHELAQEEAGAARFVAVNMVSSRTRANVNGAQPAASGIEVVLASGHRIRLEQGFDALTLRQAAAALEGVAC